MAIFYIASLLSKFNIAIFFQGKRFVLGYLYRDSAFDTQIDSD